MTRFARITTRPGRNRVPIDPAVTEIDPPGAGGGSISVTDGTTTVSPATSLRLPAGTLRDLGSGEVGVGLLLQLLTFDVHYDDPDFTDFAHTDGRVLWTPQAGDIIVDLWCIPVVKFAGADSAILYVGGTVFADALILQAALGAGGPDLTLINPPISGQDFLRPGTLTQSNETLDARVSASHVSSTPAHAIVQTGWLPTIVSANGTRITAAVTVTNGPLTAGQLRIYAIIATPAA